MSNCNFEVNRKRQLVEMWEINVEVSIFAVCWSKTFFKRWKKSHMQVTWRSLQSQMNAGQFFHLGASPATVPLQWFIFTAVVVFIIVIAHTLWAPHLFPVLFRFIYFRRKPPSIFRDKKLLVESVLSHEDPYLTRYSTYLTSAGVIASARRTPICSDHWETHSTVPSFSICMTQTRACLLSGFNRLWLLHKSHHALITVKLTGS